MRKIQWSRMASVFLCLLLSMSFMTVPASANATDDVQEKHAQTLAKAHNVSKIHRVEKTKNTKSKNADKYIQTATAELWTATNGRNQYVVEFLNDDDYTENGDMHFGLYWLTGDTVYYNEYLVLNDRVEDYTGQDSLESGVVDSFALELPYTNESTKIIGAFFHKSAVAGHTKAGQDGWSAKWMRVAKVTDNVIDSTTVKDASGYGTHTYTGEYVASVMGVTCMSGYGWGDGYVAFEQIEKQADNGSGSQEGEGTNAAGSTAKSIYILQMVAGNDGYPNKEGTVNVSYTDLLGFANSITVSFSDGYENLCPGSDLSDAHKSGNYGVSLENDWLKLTDRHTTGLAAGYVGNYYTYDKVSDTCLLPYTATDFQLVMPQNIDRIDSITVTLSNDDNLILQSVRLIELSEIGASNYWNGSFGLERTRPWSGRVVAQSNGNSHTINGESSYTWQGTTNARGLTNYARGTGPWVDNNGVGVGVTLQFADVLGAGIDQLAAANKASYTDKEAKFNASSNMKSQAGKDAWKAYFNLRTFYKECMSLEVTYKDTLGATRKVTVPYVTSYILYNLLQNQGKWSGGSASTWISGILQQNENAALALRLAQYDSLVSVKVTYGSAPSGFTSSNSGKIPTESDSVSLENICVYEGVDSTNFQSKYDSSKLALVLNTSLKPAYHWQSGSEQGQTLSGGGSLTASLSSETLKADAPNPRSTENKYVVEIKTADLDIANTTSIIKVSLNYTDTAGLQKSTAAYSMETLMSDFYGTSHRDAAENQQYERHMRRGEVGAFVVEMKDVATVDSISFSLEGSDEWQIEYVSVYKLADLQQRAGVRTVSDDKGQIDWDRAYKADDSNRMAIARQSVLLYTNAPKKTVYFTSYDEEGNAIEPEQSVKEDDYLTSLPTSMTYDDTRKNLGLSIVKHTYRIDVDVADVEDAGSTNYFYFQLVFENGTSSVVMANQQLAADSFRQGNTESFTIKTTQNYGNVKAVRIICDRTASSSDVFDKLNIEKISVTLSNDSGISKSWIVEQVGWIDITYVDEGADYGVAGLSEFVGQSIGNADVVKEFAVTNTATAVDLLFCVATAKSSTSSSLGGTVEATLLYLDGDGVEQNKSFDITAAIQEYNDTDKLSWLYRPNHVDRFRLSMTDISSVMSLIITRTDGKEKTNWIIDSVSVQQIGGLGDVFLSPELSEYYRTPISATDLARSTNDAGITYSIGPGGNTMITFTENRIDVVTQEEEDSWNATISRVPTGGTEALNIYLYPGAVLNVPYTFTTSSPVLRSTVKYTTVYGGALVQNAYELGHLGDVNGETIMYGKNLFVNAMSSLNSMVLSTTATSGTQPVIKKAIVQRTRGDVLVDTYYFDYGNFDLSVGNPEFAPSTSYVAPPMHQVLTLQPADGESHVLTAETYDVAVALRYTTNIDPAQEKTVYQTPYVYFTDAGYTAVQTGRNIEIPFDAEYVDEVVGISIITTGPLVNFDNASVENYSGARGEEGAVAVNTSYIAQSFTASTMESEIAAGTEAVVPATFSFATAAEETAVGAGTSGMVGMTVNYTDSSGQARSVQIENILRYLGEGEKPTAGTTVKLPLLLSDAAQIESIVLSAEDSWFLTSVGVDMTKPDGAVSRSVTVNNWVKSGGTLEIDLSENATGNYIQSFSVSGRGQKAGKVSSASAGNTLLVSAYRGDTVELTPAVTAVGNPDTTWTWNPGTYTNNLTVQSDNSALFSVPPGLTAGGTCTFSVTCNGDNRLTVSITVVVEEEPQEETNIDWDAESAE